MRHNFAAAKLASSLRSLLANVMWPMIDCFDTQDLRAAKALLDELAGG